MYNQKIFKQITSAECKHINSFKYIKLLDTTSKLIKDSYVNCVQHANHISHCWSLGGINIGALMNQRDEPRPY